MNGQEVFEEIKQRYEESNRYILKVSYEDIGMLIHFVEILNKQLIYRKEQEKLIKSYKANLPENVKIICLCENDFERNISDDYISKDKIKAKIEEINHVKENTKGDLYRVATNFAINVLQSFLKEE